MDNIRHGFGKLTTPRETYIGGFEYALYNGDGQLISADGSIYSGHFQSGIR
jgi:hypothetical protein